MIINEEQLQQLRDAGYTVVETVRLITIQAEADRCLKLMGAPGHRNPKYGFGKISLAIDDIVGSPPPETPMSKYWKEGVKDRAQAMDHWDDLPYAVAQQYYMNFSSLVNWTLNQVPLEHRHSLAVDLQDMSSVFGRKSD